MTGLGTGNASLKGGTVSVEIRSVNHKFVDVRTRLPSEWFALSGRVEQLARKALSRGRHEVFVRIDLDSGSDSGLNEARIRSVHERLVELGGQLGVSSDVTWQALLSVPGVFSSDGTAVDSETVLLAIGEALKAAVDDSLAMRVREGAALRRDMDARIGNMRSMSHQLSKMAATNAAERRDKLRERLQTLLAEVDEAGLDERRLEQEVAVLADRLDVSEELARLQSHFSQWDKLCEGGSPVGRKLDFLIQEMLRELNTIGSKCQHAAMAHLVVEMKAELERIREQVQNVE